MSICPVCHGRGAFLAWCHPFLSCSPLLPAGSPGWGGQRTMPDCRALGKASAPGILSTGSDLPPSLVGSCSPRFPFTSPWPSPEPSFSLSSPPSYAIPCKQTFDPFLVFPSPSHFSSSVLFSHLFCILFAPHSRSFLTVPLPSPCSLLPPPSPHALSPSFCMSECSHFCMDTHLMLLTLASPAGSRVWGN